MCVVCLQFSWDLDDLTQLTPWRSSVLQVTVADLSVEFSDVELEAPPRLTSISYDECPGTLGTGGDASI